MELLPNEYVMYHAAGLCRFKEIVRRCFDGKTQRDYIVLEPEDSDKSIYYVPCDTADKRLRRLMTKEEIYALIDSIPDIAPCECGDRNENKLIFSSVLKSDDCEKIISLIKSLYLKREDRLSRGGHLTAAEENAMKAAEHTVYQEFAAVLDIAPESVKDFIAERIEGRRK
ncbi:CarD family transcriptional regulator [Ruminococcus sp. Marseille-P6503]|uniref:CarD family transcriptional regulator n=1 Tax=Ruminococcus sp. Marseille-P6503 TaxID=2364796 RepID=UPI000F542A22|nr:CarD family transcriptional regulator [Ruminococcus sp. Marseille-P6503]